MYAIVYKVILFRFGELVRIKYNLSNFLEKEFSQIFVETNDFEFLI